MPTQVTHENTELVPGVVAAPDKNRTLIVGHSDTVPTIVKLLSGTTVPAIKDKTFDDLFIVVILGDSKSVVHLKYGQASPTD